LGYGEEDGDAEEGDSLLPTEGGHAIDPG
jgi:hypothetical protein